MVRCLLTCMIIWMYCVLVLICVCIVSEHFVLGSQDIFHKYIGRIYGSGEMEVGTLYSIRNIGFGSFSITTINNCMCDINTHTMNNRADETIKQKPKPYRQCNEVNMLARLFVCCNAEAQVGTRVILTCICWLSIEDGQVILTKFTSKKKYMLNGCWSTSIIRYTTDMPSFQFSFNSVVIRFESHFSSYVKSICFFIDKKCLRKYFYCQQ